jgi:hypothetical protein
MANAPSNSAATSTSSSSTMKTRVAVKCPVFGKPSELHGNVLPTYEQVMQFCAWTRFSKKETKKEPTFAEIAEVVVDKLEDIWNKASIPVVSRKRIVKLLQTYHTKYVNLLKPFKSRQNDSTYITKIQSFKDEASSRLFDIAACKCDLTSESVLCGCEKSRKVPAIEVPFLLDQRSARKMAISNIDIIQTKKIQQNERRKQKVALQSGRDFNLTRKECSASTLDLDSSDTSEPEVASDSEKQYTNEHSKTPKVKDKSNQMRVSLKTLANTCDRYGVSDRSAAAIASAVLQDIGVVTTEDKSKVIDRSKVRRERQENRSNLQDDGLDVLSTNKLTGTGLYFDGRKDKTLLQVKKGKKYYRQTIVEEHVSLVQEPGGKYIGHVSPASGTAEVITKSITEFLTEHSIDIANLELIGCDGTNVNTGYKGGVIRLLEEYFRRPIQWAVCMFHGNELPLRHLLHHLDGQTTGPRGFSGPIGKKLELCEKLPVIVFKSIDTNLPEIHERIIKDLSTDQKYMYQMVKAIASGNCSIDLATRDPGRISHSRWVTTANRLLRLYISTENPTDELVTLVTYVMRVYASMWFHIKIKPSCENGAHHLWRTISLSRYLEESLKNVVDPVIQRNAFYGHAENILLGMLTDKRAHVRQLGLRRIMKARSESATAATADTIRVFQVPLLNFKATDYIDLIKWQDCQVTEPPVTVKLSNNKLQELIGSKETPKYDFQKYCCHTQVVERTVKLVTEASASVCGAEARDGFIRATMDSRAKMPYFNTKANFVP